LRCVRVCDKSGTRRGERQREEKNIITIKLTIKLTIRKAKHGARNEHESNNQPRVSASASASASICHDCKYSTVLYSRGEVRRGRQIRFPNTAAEIDSKSLEIDNQITKMSGIYETLHTTTVCALQMTQPKRSKTVSSLGISAGSPPITYHSHKVRVDN
jgi:hypothetical protein